MTDREKVFFGVVIAALFLVLWDTRNSIADRLGALEGKTESAHHGTASIDVRPETDQESKAFDLEAAKVRFNMAFHLGAMPEKIQCECATCVKHRKTADRLWQVARDYHAEYHAGDLQPVETNKGD